MSKLDKYHVKINVRDPDNPDSEWQIQIIGDVSRNGKTRRFVVTLPLNKFYQNTEDIPEEELNEIEKYVQGEFNRCVLKLEKKENEQPHTEN